MTSFPCLRIGTRTSALARWQAEWVAARLTEQGAAVELVPISTRGDRDQQGPIGNIAGGDGVFTKELERALLAGEIDLAMTWSGDLFQAARDNPDLAGIEFRTMDMLEIEGQYDCITANAARCSLCRRGRKRTWSGCARCARPRCPACTP